MKTNSIAPRLLHSLTPPERGRLARPAAKMAALLLLAAYSVLQTFAAPPVVSNIRAAQRPGSQLVDIYYNVTSPNATLLKVSFAVSANAGTNYGVPVFTYTGAAGAGVAAGSDRLITWNAGADWGGQFSSQCRVRVVADDGTAPAAPTGMAYIPGGAFQMGDSFLDSLLYSNLGELPVHNVYVSPFFMDKFEVSREIWSDVYSWAVGNGYSFQNTGSFMGANHPVQTINWYDAVKWCNARSEKAGLSPCYYTDATQTTVYRTGQLDLTNACVKWTANGYRLPTEVEWEKAARGGMNGRRFPWGDTITHSNANYLSVESWSYDISPTRGQHPTYSGTSPVGVFAANGYGLYDMAGNLYEWCWDWYDSDWYGQLGAGSDDSRGPVVLSHRVFRGGAWADVAYQARCARRVNDVPSRADYIVGFRCARGL